MLNDIKEEKFLFLFFVVALIIVIYLSVCMKSILDFSFLIVIMYYFFKFLVNMQNE